MTTKSNKICIVIPYFGKWPFWINHFLLSCRYNPTINWVFFTDCGLVANCPPNVKMIEISYQAYCEQVSQKLSINFKPDNPYKLCDIRPAIGDTHADILQDYDFWGFGDIDLVYGDLRTFFSDKHLATKDVFSNHATRISGHLCLIRNLPDINQAYHQIPLWRQKVESEQHFAIDEKDFSKLFLRHKNSPKWLQTLAAWRDPWLKRAEFIERYSTPNARIAWLDGRYFFPTQWCWNAGKLTNNLDKNVEFAYFHFLIWKKQWAANHMQTVPKNDESFFIDQYGFN